MGETDIALADQSGQVVPPEGTAEIVKSMTWGVSIQQDEDDSQLQVGYDDEARDDEVLEDHAPSVSSITFSRTIQGWYDRNFATVDASASASASAIANADAMMDSSSCGPVEQQQPTMTTSKRNIVGIRNQQHQLIKLMPATWLNKSCLTYTLLGEPSDVGATLKSVQRNETNYIMFKRRGMVVAINANPTTDEVAKYSLPRQDSLSFPVFNACIS